MSPTVESRVDRGVQKTCFRCLVSMAHAVIVWVEGGGMEEEHIEPLPPPLKLPKPPISQYGVKILSPRDFTDF